MTWAIAAISVTDQIEKYGAYAGLAAIIGLGVLSLLYFAHAREVKRLREWAGRAPERAAELEARVAADAARRTSAAPLRAQTPAGQAAASTATATAAGAPAPAAVGAKPAGAEGETKVAEPVKAPVPGLPVPVPAASGTASAPGGSAAPPASAPAEGTSPDATPADATTPGTPAPATPSPAGNGVASTPPAAAGPRVPGRPPPVPATPPPAATPPPTAAPATAAGTSRPLRGAPPSRTLPPRDEPGEGRHGPSRRVLGVLGGSLLVVAAVVVVLLVTLGGDSTPPPPNQVAETSGRTTDVGPARTQSSRQARIDRADTPVVVLNGTGVNGLARQVADRLQSTGYQAAVDNTQARPTTVIGYKQGAEPAAREIGKLLEVPSAQIQPMPPDLTGVAGTNAVVVVIGADKATD
jgi:hypothetical protein